MKQSSSWEANCCRELINKSLSFCIRQSPTIIGTTKTHHTSQFRVRQIQASLYPISSRTIPYSVSHNSSRQSQNNPRNGHFDWDGWITQNMAGSRVFFSGVASVNTQTWRRPSSLNQNEYFYSWKDVVHAQQELQKHTAFWGGVRQLEDTTSVHLTW